MSSPSDFGDPRSRSADAELTTRLISLFTALSTTTASPGGTSLQERLTAFFAAMAELGRSEPAPPPPPSPPDVSRLRALLVELAPQLAAARLDGRLTDVWSIARIGRNEVRNAAVLAGLWNPRLCGSIATEFLTEFIAALPARPELPTADELATGYAIRTEDRPLDRADERVDIVVEGATFLLGIELKIDAVEGEDQLASYLAALTQRGVREGRRPGLVFLSPQPPRDPSIHHAGWRDVAEAARRIVPPRERDRTFVHQLVAQFAVHVSAF